MKSLLKVLKLQNLKELSESMWKDFEALNLTPQELVKPYRGHYKDEEIKEVLIEIASYNPGWWK